MFKTMPCSAAYFRAAVQSHFSCAGHKRFALKMDLQDSLFWWQGPVLLSRVHLHSRKCQCAFSTANRSFLQFTDINSSNPTHLGPLTAGLEIPALTTPKPNFPNPSFQPHSPTVHKKKSKRTLQTCCLNDFQYYFSSAIRFRVTGLDTNTKTTLLDPEQAKQFLSMM